MPLISVIMPSYNHHKYIQTAVESVLSQTVEDLELIIVDDFSQDGTRGLLNESTFQDKRIRFFFHEKNLGIAKTLNEGMDHALGKFVAFIASDDVWVKEKLEMQMKELNLNDNFVVWSEGMIIDQDGRLVGDTFTNRCNAANLKKSGNIFEELLQKNFIFGSSLIVKRESLRDVRYDENLRFLNDYRFAVDLAHKYEYRFVEKPMAMYRVHGENAIILNENERLIDSVRINNYFLEEYSKAIPDYIRFGIFRRMMNSYLRLRDIRNAFSMLVNWISTEGIRRSNMRDVVFFLAMTPLSLLRCQGAYSLFRKTSRKIFQKDWWLYHKNAS